MLGHFEDPQVGFVQALVAHGNQAESFVANAVAAQAYDVFSPTSMGMHGAGAATVWGAHCTFRHAALDAIGGHQVGLAEDLHTSLVMHSHGWKSVYVPVLVARGFVPADLGAYTVQQLKWSRGVFEILLEKSLHHFRRLEPAQAICYLTRMTYYLVGPFTLVTMAGVASMLYFGRAYADGHMTSYIAHFVPLALMIVVVRMLAVGMWEQDPDAPGRFHYPGLALAVGSWPIYTLSLVCALLRIRFPHLATPKQGQGGQFLPLVVPQLCAVAILLGGVARRVSLGLDVDSLILVGFALLLAGSALGGLLRGLGGLASPAPGDVEPRSGHLSWVPRAGQGELLIAWLGALSGLLYLVVHFTQNALLNPALTPVGATSNRWDDPANGGQLLLLLGSYATAVIGLLAIYDRVVRLAGQYRGLRRTRWLVLGLPVVFYLGGLLSSPFFSTDLYSYAAYGFIGTLPAGNPYFQEGQTILATPFGVQLVELGWRGSALSPYGPVWNLLATAAVRLTSSAAQAVVLLKLTSCSPRSGRRRRLRAAGANATRLPGCGDSGRAVATGARDPGRGRRAQRGPRAWPGAVFARPDRVAASRGRHGRAESGGLDQVRAERTPAAAGRLLVVDDARSAEPARAAGAERGPGRCARSPVLCADVARTQHVPRHGCPGYGGASGAPLRRGRLGCAAAADRGRWRVVLLGAWWSRSGARLMEASALVMLLALLVGPQKFWPWYAALPVGLLALSPGHLFRWLTLVTAACVLLASPIEALPMNGQGIIGFELQTQVFRGARMLPLLALVALAGTWGVTARRQAARARAVRPIHAAGQSSDSPGS